MNPYNFSEPAVLPDYSIHPFKIKTKSCDTTSSRIKRRKSNLLSLILGTFFGYLGAVSVRNIILDQSCLLEKKIFKIETYSDSFHSQDAISTNSLIFIGVITANKFLDTRVKAVYDTWGKHTPGKLSFFTSGHSEFRKDLPLVRLEGVDDSYPPQKKSLMMLKYMYDFHINDFEFFMRADDDLYVRTDHLETLLHSINSSELHYIGTAGIGLPDERSHLNLGTDNYCMGGPGIIFSRAALIRMGPYLEECLYNLESSHEDVELGRCVKKYIGISCTWAFEMRDIFHHENSEFFSGALKQKEVHRAITLHPLKNHTYHHRVHNYYKKLLIKEKEGELVKILREIDNLKRKYHLDSLSLDNLKNGIFLNHIGSGTPRREKFASNLLEWDFLTNKATSQIIDDNPKHRLTSCFKEGISDVLRDVMEDINSISEKRGRIISFQEFSYLYKRYQPTFGAEYIFDMMLYYRKFRGKKMTVPVRRHAYIEVPFGPLYINNLEGESYTIEDEVSILGALKKRPLGDILKKQFGFSHIEGDTLKHKKINFILPLAGRYETFIRFIGDFIQVCLQKDENVRLIIVSFRSSPTREDTRHKVKSKISSLKNKFPAALIDIMEPNVTFSRAKALQLGSSLLQDNDLLFFVDVDITFSSKALQKIRLHTIQREQAYFPIVFSEFNPGVSQTSYCDKNCTNFLINEESGYWRSFGFGIASIYHSDLQRIGGFNTSIIGWGGEDIDLFEKVLQTQQLKVMRVADPDLIHIFHFADCATTNLKDAQSEMCKGTLYSTYASSHTLVKLLHENPHILSFKAK